MKAVKDVMTKGVFSVQEDFSIYDVAEVMAKYDISGVVVLNKEGSAEGTLSRMDVLRPIAEGEDLENLRAKDIMTPCVITADPEMSLEEAAMIMQKEGISRLFVCVDERVTPATLGKKYIHRAIGIISVSDIVRELSR
jgi:CBS domain-containing protein